MSLQLLLSAALLALVASQSYVTEDPNLCPQPTESNPVPAPFFYGNSGDCTYYYTCSHGSPKLMQCGSGMRWSNFSQACVEFNSHYDTCTRNNAIRECQRDASLLIAHPFECQRFYNCSSPDVHEKFSPFELFETECPYPQVFDLTDKKCKSYKEVECGPLRSAAKAPCDYLMNGCGWSARCVPCSYREPSCVGLEDGIHGHPIKQWTSWVIRCEQERTVEVTHCPAHPTLKIYQTYNPVKDACVSLWEIPRDKGGLEPSCDGLAAGVYRTQERPDIYYSCPGVEVGYCLPGTQLNEDTKQCQ